MALLKDTEHSFNTPDLVSVRTEVVGIGTRFIGHTLDTMIVQIIIFCVIAVFLLIFSLSPSLFQFFSEIGAFVRNFIIAALILMYFFIFWGYHIYFEVFKFGRTPGKKLAGSRVVKMDGTPITFRDSLIRNLLRIVDMLPVSYVVGAISHFANENGQRLGDISAGTIVVREHGRSYLDNVKKQESARLARAEQRTVIQEGARPYDWIQLTNEEYELVLNFLDRSGTMRKKNADRLAASLAQRIGEKYNVDPAHYKNSPSKFLGYLV